MIFWPEKKILGNVKQPSTCWVKSHHPRCRDLVEKITTFDYMDFEVWIFRILKKWFYWWSGAFFPWHYTILGISPAFTTQFSLWIRSISFTPIWTTTSVPAWTKLVQTINVVALHGITIPRSFYQLYGSGKQILCK